MFQTDNTNQISHAGSIKKCALGVSLALGLGGLPTVSNAALSTSTLSFTLGAPGTASCNYGTTPPCNKASYAVTDILGSWFAMDTNGNGPEAKEKTPIGSFNGLAMGTSQAASGSHSGPINGSESPNIDKPWEFFGGTGMHQTTSPATVATTGATNIIDLSGWNVTWNGIPSIPLVEGPDIDPDNGGPLPPTTVICDTAGCSHGETYVLDGAFHVSGAGFTTVPYFLHMEGFVAASDQPPIAVDDTAKTIIRNAVPVNVTSNDASGTVPKYAPGSVVSTAPANGTTTDNADNTITYTPTSATAGTDSFDYTVANAFGRSPAATVIIDVQENVPPVANTDSAGTNIAAFENAGGVLEINVIANDTDENNLPGLAGGINPDTVTILSQPPAGEGTCTANADGTVTYAQTPPFIEVTTSCTYQVTDIDSSGTPLTSNVATVNIDITAISSDWPAALDPDIIPFLIYEDGVNSAGDTSVRPTIGSYFSMEVNPGVTTIFTTMTKGADGGFVIGYDQISGNSHQGLPTGNEVTTVDRGWNFFGNTGMSFTKNGGIVGNPDGTLKFNGDPNVNGGQGKYQITWNAIPEIDLGGAPQFPQDLGFAVISCNPAPCDDGSTFDLTYEAHVPPGDPSGFGGVQYGLFMTGDVVFLDGSLQTSDGTFDVEERLTPEDLAQDGIPPDPDSEIQCAGSCFDYTITGITPGSSVSVILPLSGGVPTTTSSGAPTLRVFRDGAWGDFDTSGSDTVLSAPFISGGDFGKTCPPAGDAAYGDLTEDHQCLQVTIEDNGPNDKNPADGIITDPSGLGVPTIVQGPDLRSSGDSGCTVTTRPTSPTQGGAWWILAGLVAWLGWNRRKHKQH